MQADSQNTPQEEPAPPQTLEDFMSWTMQIMTRMQDMTNATNARIATLENDNAAMRTFIEANIKIPRAPEGDAASLPSSTDSRGVRGTPLTSGTPSGPTLSGPASAGAPAGPYPPVSSRKPLPMGEPFSGSKSAFRAWRVTMEHKLSSDAAFIGGPRDMFAFIWSQLSASVQREVAPFYEIGGNGGVWDPTEFLKYLEFCYSDNHSRERAQTKLESLRQGHNESFSDFFIRFEQLLVQSGGSKWDDEQRLLKLRRALNNRIRAVAMNRGVTRTNYDAAVAAYKSIAVDVETMAIEDRMRPSTTPGTSQRRDGDGDVEMTTVSVTRTSPPGASQPRRGTTGRKGPTRATWVPDALYRQRREANLCTRCGEEGHIRRECANAVVTTVRLARAIEDAEDGSEGGNDVPPA